MKNYIKVKVEVEYSASHIETFTEKVSANVQSPLAHAINTVAEKLKRRGVKYPMQLNYWAY